MKLITANELIESEIAAGATSKRITMSDSAIILDGWYEIEFERISTSEEILSWVHHLCEKNWFDQMIQRRFIEVAMRRIGKTAWPVPA